MTKEYFASLVKRLKEGGNQRAWLDVVWSAAVLDMITGEMTASVLNGDFVNSLERTVLKFIIFVVISIS